MIFSDFLDSVESNEQEQQLKEVLLQIVNTISPSMLNIPIAGKALGALVALHEAESIEGFRQSEHYIIIKDFDVTANLDKGMLFVYPGAGQRKQIAMIFAAVCVGLFLLWFCLKRCRKRLK